MSVSFQISVTAWGVVLITGSWERGGGRHHILKAKQRSVFTSLLPPKLVTCWASLEPVQSPVSMLCILFRNSTQFLYIYLDQNTESPASLGRNKLQIPAGVGIVDAHLMELYVKHSMVPPWLLFQPTSYPALVQPSFEGQQLS